MKRSFIDLLRKERVAEAAANVTSVLAGPGAMRMQLRWLLIACCVPFTAHAFENLNTVQTLVYDTAHLQNTDIDQQLSYHYTFTDTSVDETIKDKVVLAILKKRDNQRRDVSVEFLSEERRMHLPKFDNYRGNPVVIAMLEHLAQSMGRDTGGGALYFRNRIRDNLASDSVELTSGTADKSETPFAYEEYTEFTLTPFLGDPFLVERPEYVEATITMRFSEDVPGQIVSIKLISGPSTKPKITREIALGAD